MLPKFIGKINVILVDILVKKKNPIEIGLLLKFWPKSLFSYIFLFLQRRNAGHVDILFGSMFRKASKLTIGTINNHTVVVHFEKNKQTKNKNKNKNTIDVYYLVPGSLLFSDSSSFQTQSIMDCYITFLVFQSKQPMTHPRQNE